MARLYRPHIPLKVRCRVAERQLIIGTPVVAFLDVPREPFGARLDGLLSKLAGQLGCDVKELRLDHDPPLGARKKRGEGKRTVYSPAANDPAHLFYRPHGPQHEGSHLIKTNVRGDHGQHPDRVLIKKQRRMERGAKPKRGTSFVRRPAKYNSKYNRPKRKWPKRSFSKKGSK